jgi:hypothetical protein
MSTTKKDDLAAPQDAADAIVHEILRRRITTAESRRQDRNLRRTQQDNPWFGHTDLALRIEAEVEEHALLLALTHLWANVLTGPASSAARGPSGRSSGRSVRRVAAQLGSRATSGSPRTGPIRSRVRRITARARSSWPVDT